MKRYMIVFALVLALAVFLAVPAGSAFAQTIVFTDMLDIIIEDGETREGDVNVSGGELVVKAGGTINGDVSVFGGNATVNGTIDGDIVVFGGNVTLNGVVEGDLVSFGGNLDVTESGNVDGDCVVLGGNVTDNSNSTSCARVDENFPFGEGLWSGRVGPPVEWGPGPDVRVPPVIEPPSFMSRLGSFLLGVGGAVGGSLIAAFVAFLIAALMPEHLERTTNVVRDKPLASGMVGVLSIVSAPALLTLWLILSALLILACGIGLLGFPIAIVLVIGMFIAGVFGWVAMGNLLGRRIARMLRMKSPSLAFTAAFGTFLIALFLGLLGIPRNFPLEDILTFVILALGLGATVLTQFGTKPYPREPEMNDRTDKVDIVLKNMPSTE